MKEILLLVQKCAHTFSFYDLETKQAIKHIVLPNFPHEFTVDAEKRFAYVGIFGIETAWTRGEQGDCRIAEIDLKEQKLTRLLDMWPYYRPHGMASDNEGRIYAMSEGNDTLVVFDKPREQIAPNLAVPSGGIKTHLVTLTKDANTAYGVHLLSNTVTQFHPRDATVTPKAVMPGPRPEGNALSKDEKLLYVANRGDNTLVEIDTTTMTVKRSVPTRNDPNRIYRTDGENGEELLLLTNSGERSISVFESSSLKEIQNIPLPANPTALCFHPNKNIAYVSFQDDYVRELDMTTWQFVHEMPTLREADASFVLLME